MNDVKITEQKAGGLWVEAGGTRFFNAAEVAALRAHFAAERPAFEVNWEALDLSWLIEHPDLNRAQEEAVSAHAAEVKRLRAEQPATPTPSTEQMDAAWSKVWGFRSETRSRMEEDNARMWFNRGADAALAALVSPVSEQPTPLDPEPWTTVCDEPFCSGHRSRHNNGGYQKFNPRPEFEQDRARYVQGGE